MKYSALAVLFASAALSGCTRVPLKHADAMSAVAPEPLGEERLSYKWKFETADRRTEVTPQEFASPAVWADTVYVGSARGWFYALKINASADFEVKSSYDIRVQVTDAGGQS